MERRRRRRESCSFIFLNDDFLLDCVFLVCVFVVFMLNCLFGGKMGVVCCIVYV